MVPFKVGYCPITGAQSQVTTTRQGVLAGLVGSTLVWLCLCETDPSGAPTTVKTRVGTVALAPGVDPLTADPLEVEASLLASPYSGVTTLEPEASMWPGRKLEVVLVYGE